MFGGNSVQERILDVIEKEFTNMSDECKEGNEFIKVRVVVNGSSSADSRES